MSQHLNHKNFKEESWMTFEEAQEFFKISRRTLYRWCKTKQLPYTIIGGTRYFPRYIIQNIMASKLNNIIKK